MQRASRSAWGWLLLGALGCAPQAQTPAPATIASGTRETEGAPSTEPAPTTTARPRADVLYASPEAVPDASGACTQGRPLAARLACPDARQQLAAALLQKDPGALDAALLELEPCEKFPLGLVRALRAELGPAECADHLVLPLVGEAANVPGITPELRETLVALGLAARLRRLAQEPPQAPSSRTKDDLTVYFKEQLFPWIEKQAEAIFAMSSQGTALSGYPRGIVAVEAGNADMRFVEIARNVPVSAEISEYEEAKDVYYAALDEQLEPRKTRGRNAALVGLREMSRAGVRTSQRVHEARELLSRAYGGRRVNALDLLLVPELPAVQTQDAADTIASRVPTPYVTTILGKEPVSAHLVGAALQMGMPLGLRRAVESSDDDHAQLLLARALFESGRSYFQASDFQSAQALLNGLLDGQSQLTQHQKEQAALLRALSVALVAGPKDAAELIAKGPRFADSLGNLVILDGLADSKGPLGGRAGFDAAYLRELVAPAAAPEYWKDLSSRYRASSMKLEGNEASIARERAAACSEIEKTVRKQVTVSPRPAP